MAGSVKHYFGGGAAALNMHERMSDVLMLAATRAMQDAGGPHAAARTPVPAGCPAASTLPQVPSQSGGHAALRAVHRQTLCSPRTASVPALAAPPKHAATATLRAAATLHLSINQSMLYSCLFGTHSSHPHDQPRVPNPQTLTPCRLRPGAGGEGPGLHLQRRARCVRCGRGLRERRARGRAQPGRLRARPGGLRHLLPAAPVLHAAPEDPGTPPSNGMCACASWPSSALQTGVCRSRRAGGGGGGWPVSPLQCESSEQKRCGAGAPGQPADGDGAPGARGCGHPARLARPPQQPPPGQLQPPQVQAPAELSSRRVGSFRAAQLQALAQRSSCHLGRISPHRRGPLPGRSCLATVHGIGACWQLRPEGLPGVSHTGKWQESDSSVA